MLVVVRLRYRSGGEGTRTRAISFAWFLEYGQPRRCVTNWSVALEAGPSILAETFGLSGALAAGDEALASLYRDEEESSAVNCIVR